MCTHSAWLRTFTHPSFGISYSSRLKTISQTLPDPDYQYPSVLLGLGKQSKERAFKELFPQNNLPRKREQAFANIFVDNSSLTSTYPIFFAESDPTLPLTGHNNFSFCHENKIYHSAWAAGSADCRPEIYGNLLFPICDVICLFADDLGSIADAFDLIQDWVSKSGSSEQPRQIRPHLLVISTASAEEDEQRTRRSIIETEDLTPVITRLTPANWADSFVTIDRIRIHGRDLSSESKSRALKSVILQRMDSARAKKIVKRRLFSATHLAALFSARLPLFAKCSEYAFSAIRASRGKNEVRSDRFTFLDIFMRLCAMHDFPIGNVAHHIASSFLLHAYPPSMHMFDPLDVYETLFEHSCSTAAKMAYEATPENADQLCTVVKEYIIALYSCIELGMTASELHRSSIISSPLPWKRMQSTQCCLSCVASTPEHTLFCGHSLCDNCVRIYGKPDPFLEHCFLLDECMFCDEPRELTVTLKPPTAAVRLLSVDGGGVRGIVPLEFLRLLQLLLGPDCKLQDFFDLVIGTSAGGLIVLGLFLQRWDIPKCIRLFRAMTGRAFNGNGNMPPSRFQKAIHLVIGLLKDSCYDIGKVDQAFQEAFGVSKRMFDTPSSLQSKSKVAVTATTISDATTFLFSNYNGGKRDPSCGYKHFRPFKHEDEPTICDIAKATTAAPLLFKAADLDSVGTFQDGGLRHNNPTDLTLWEKKWIWPAGTPQDVVLSLGTGSEVMDPTQSPIATKFKGILTDGFIPRLCRSFMASLDGEMAWRNLRNRLTPEDQQDFFRFNIRYPGREPNIDDVSCMDALIERVNEEVSKDDRLLDLAISILISSFYFELDCVPSFEEGLYRCSGAIRCRENCHHVVKALRKLIESPINLLISSEATEPFELNSLCQGCGRFVKKITFFVRHPSHKVLISLEFGGKKRKVSGFPQTMDWFSEEQELSSVYGRRDHSYVDCTYCETCSPVLNSGNESLGSSPRKRPCVAAKQRISTNIRPKSQRLTRSAARRMQLAQSMKRKSGISKQDRNASVIHVAPLRGELDKALPSLPWS